MSDRPLVRHRLDVWYDAARCIIQASVSTHVNGETISVRGLDVGPFDDIAAVEDLAMHAVDRQLTLL